jgi:UDP-glucose 4-epimerase
VAARRGDLRIVEAAPPGASRIHHPGPPGPGAALETTDLAENALIVGGTGSFGRTMLDRILSETDHCVTVFSRDEEKQHALRTKLQSDRVRFHIGDVRNLKSVTTAMQGIDYVFHAAALKQVPSCEFFPMEAIQTNIIGSQNVIDSAIQCGVKKAVFLSTDKSVFPINAMGMTKALMEKLVLARVRTDPDCPTVLCIVRYGNVLGSRGSVVPAFIDRIVRGEPISVTNPDMTRFLLTLPDAVRLVDLALEVGRPGDIFVKKAPASTVGDLARAMIEIFDRDVGINVIGERVGEKLYETLASAAEVSRAENLDEYFRIPQEVVSLNYEVYFDVGSGAASTTCDYHSHNTNRLERDELNKLLLSLPIVKQGLRRAGRMS